MTSEHGEQTALRLLVAFVCGKELLGLMSRRYPQLRVRTWSRHMWDMPPRRRLIVWAVVVAVLTDHFFTRRFT